MSCFDHRFEQHIFGDKEGDQKAEILFVWQKKLARRDAHKLQIYHTTKKFKQK